MRQTKIRAPEQQGLLPEKGHCSSQVKWWAALGAVSTIVVVSGWTRWLLDGPATAPAGPDQMSDLAMLLYRASEVASAGAVFFVLWRFLFRPLLRDRTLTLDGMIVIAVFLMWFYDPLVNYFNFSVNYNAHLINVASWADYIPGMATPNAHLEPEPIFFVGGSYIWWSFGAILIGCAILRRLEARYPSMTTLGRFTALFGIVSVGEMIAEMPVVHSQIWVYAGAPRALTLWAGKPYQLPIYEGILAGLWITGMTAVRYVKDDHGRSFVESGVEKLGLSNRGQKAVSLMAVIGAMTFVFIGMYWVPSNYFALKADTVPALPSYLRTGICGEGTDYACPSEYVPIPHGRSLHVRPDDPGLPDWVRARQGSP